MSLKAHIGSSSRFFPKEANLTGSQTLRRLNSLVKYLISIPTSVSCSETLYPSKSPLHCHVCSELTAPDYCLRGPFRSWHMKVFFEVQQCTYFLPIFPLFFSDFHVFVGRKYFTLGESMLAQPRIWENSNTSLFCTQLSTQINPSD